MAKDPKQAPRKPTGVTGPFTVRADGIQHEEIRFPATKVEIERMIGKLFVDNAGSIPISLAPFSNLRSNSEDDLDFTVACGDGRDRLLELVEFAPLQELGVSYEDAPRQMGIQQMAQFVTELIAKKSARQGGVDRLLLIYKTAQQFFISPPVQELVRRMLAEKAPRFDAVYFLSPHDAVHATVFEVWPGKSHEFFRDLTNEKLGTLRLIRAYPDEFVKTKVGGKVVFKRRP